MFFYLVGYLRHLLPKSGGQITTPVSNVVILRSSSNLRSFTQYLHQSLAKAQFEAVHSYGRFWILCRASKLLFVNPKRAWQNDDLPRAFICKKIILNFTPEYITEDLTIATMTYWISPLQNRNYSRFTNTWGKTQSIVSLSTEYNYLTFIPRARIGYEMVAPSWLLSCHFQQARLE